VGTQEEEDVMDNEPDMEGVTDGDGVRLMDMDWVVEMVGEPVNDLVGVGDGVLDLLAPLENEALAVSDTLPDEEDVSDAVLVEDGDWLARCDHDADPDWDAVPEQLAVADMDSDWLAPDDQVDVPLLVAEEVEVPVAVDVHDGDSDVVDVVERVAPLEKDAVAVLVKLREGLRLRVALLDTVADSEGEGLSDANTTGPSPGTSVDNEVEGVAEAAGVVEELAVPVEVRLVVVDPVPVGDSDAPTLQLEVAVGVRLTVVDAVGDAD
jgi:hypothetical protein